MVSTRHALRLAIVSSATLILAVVVAIATFKPAWMASSLNGLHRLGMLPYRYKVQTMQKKVPPPVKQQAAPDLPYNLKVLAGSGQHGLVTWRSLVIYQGSKPVEQKVVNQATVQPPKPTQLLVGTNKNLVAVGKKIYPVKKTMTMVATAYSGDWGSNGQWTGQPSRIGIPLQWGVVAVDPKVIPLGTRLYVQGYGLAVAADTGSAIHGNRIDLYMSGNLDQVKSFGIQKRKVWILNLPVVKANTKAAEHVTDPPPERLITKKVVSNPAQQVKAAAGGQ